MTKEQKQTLKELRKEKKYEEIFVQFGQKEFVKSVDEKYKIQDINKLKREGKFEDIYLRYGKGTYNKLLNEFKQREIEEVYGKKSVKAISHKVYYKIRSAIGLLLYSIGIIGTQQGVAQIGASVLGSEIIKNENKKQYEDLIEEYEEGVAHYAENVRKMGLTDLEIFMKLQDDMHNSIKGYGTPQLDIEGYFGVDIGQEYGTGVCRNMADDIVNKLNAINPDYNARMFIVKSKQGERDQPDITVNFEDIIIGKNTKFDTMRVAEHTIATIIDNYDFIGNHAVVAVDLKKENVTLIIDPTNICLGVFKDGKITIFNSLDKEQPYSMYRTPLDDFAYRGIQSLEVPIEYAKSFLNPFIEIDELNEKYGLEAQQKALESAKAKEEDYIYQCSKKNNFKDGLKVNLENSEGDIYSTEELKSLYSKCMQNVYNINSTEEILQLANICRKIDYSINYYNQKQEEIVGKHINFYGIIGERLDLDMSSLRKIIAEKMIETNAVVLPEDEEVKEFLCIAYLQAGEQEQIEDLKVTFDEEENNYYILNNDTLLATVNKQYDKEGNSQGISYNKNNTKTDDEIKILIDNSFSIMQVNEQITDVINNDNKIEER